MYSLSGFTDYALAFTGSLFLYRFLLVIYRLYFHPLSHVPGPKLAAATWLYQTYHSFSGEGSQYYLQIVKLHEIYGV